MKNPIMNTLTLFSLFLASCVTPLNNNNEAIKELEVKLTATEAQLINVSAELARCKGDIETTEIDSTQLDNTPIN